MNCNGLAFLAGGWLPEALIIMILESSQCSVASASGTASGGSHGAGPWHVALPVAVTVPGLVVPGPVPVSGWRVGPAAGPVAGSASDRPGPAPALRTVSLVPLCCQCLNLNLAMADLEPEACRWDQGHRHETRAERRPPAGAARSSNLNFRVTRPLEISSVTQAQTCGRLLKAANFEVVQCQPQPE